MIEARHKLNANATPADGSWRALENDRLKATFLPERGGKIVSLIDTRTQTEWLLPPLRPHAEAVATAGFDAWDGGGFDECLPTVAVTETAPDHGEVWRRPWQEEHLAGAVALSTTALGGAVLFERTARLDGASLVLDYRVTNGSSTVQSLLYSAHPLLRVERGDCIQLPPQVQSVRIGSNDGRLGAQGDNICWPAADEDLSVVGPPDGRQADKLFAGPLGTGWCRLLRPSTGEALELSFNADVLPYLGIWICRAAWPETGTAKQYSVAFEPTSANCDSLADAERTGTAWRLEPGGRREWTLRFRLATESSAAESNGAKGDL